MVLFLLCMKADLEGVGSIQLLPDTNLCIDVRNPLSDYETREKVIINSTEYVPQDDNSREPPFHFGLSWEGNKKQSTVTILNEDEIKTAFKKIVKKSKGSKSEVGIPRSITSEDNGQFVPILALECRGLEPFAFHPSAGGGEFVVESEGGVKFEEDIDFTDDWAEYDDQNDSSVSVSAIEFKFISV